MENADAAYDFGNALYEKHQEEIMKRLPDAMELHVSLLSPLIQLESKSGLIMPRKNLHEDFVLKKGASATFTLGSVLLRTMEPCYAGLYKLRLGLDETSLQVTTVQREKFYVLKPVPIKVDLEMQQRGKLNNVSIILQIENCYLHVAPQACKVLLTVPQAITGILDKQSQEHNEKRMMAAYEKLREKWEVARNAKLGSAGSMVGGSPGKNDELMNTDASAEAQKRLTRITTELEARRSRVSGAAVKAANAGRYSEQAGGQVTPSSSSSTKVDSSPGGATSSSQMTAEEHPSTQVNMSMSFSKLDIVLGDTVIPVLELQMQLPDVFLFFHSSIPPGSTKTVHPHQVLSINTDRGFFIEINIYNTRCGSWEPLIETFNINKFSLEMRGTKGLDISFQADQRPLLINFSPTAIQKLKWFVPYFAESLKAEQAVPASEGKRVSDKIGEIPARGFGSTIEVDDDAVDFAKFRCLNLLPAECDVLFYMQPSAGATKGATDIKQWRAEQLQKNKNAADPTKSEALGRKEVGKTRVLDKVANKPGVAPYLDLDNNILPTLADEVSVHMTSSTGGGGGPQRSRMSPEPKSSMNTLENFLVEDYYPDKKGEGASAETRRSEDASPTKAGRSSTQVRHLASARGASEKLCLYQNGSIWLKMPTAEDEDDNIEKAYSTLAR